MAKFKSLHTVDELVIPNLVLKVKPYIYGDKKSLADPTCDVRIHADLWVTTGKWKMGFNSKPSMKFFARARIDLDDNAFYESKTGRQITVDNAPAAIEAIRAAMEKPREEEDGI